VAGTMTVGVEKIIQKKFSSVGSQINVYGGKTGMAMIKYPLYKKNNSRKNSLLYPDL